MATSRKHKRKPKGNSRNRSATMEERLCDFRVNHLAVPTRFPTKFRFYFSCKKCYGAIPIEPEEVVRHASSVEEAYESHKAFVKTVEPRTVKCQCNHEDEYRGTDVDLGSD